MNQVKINQWNLRQRVVLVQVPRVLRRVRRGANATFACHADAARVAPVLAAPAVCAPGHLLRRAAPPPAALRLLGAAMQMRATAAERARGLPLHPQGSPAAGGHL